MLHTPFYDPHKSYEENYNKGPSGAFADGNVLKQDGVPHSMFLGVPVHLALGIPSGPLLNSTFCKSAFEKGWDIAVYKTVRSTPYPCHPFPNVLSLHIDGDLRKEKLQQPLIADNDYHEPLTITNSFGVPSKTPDVWQVDVQKAISYAGDGQVLVLSFMGTVKEHQTQQEFIEDYILAGKLAHQTRAKILEVNLSCPNIGNEGLVCYNLDVTKKVLEGLRKTIGNTPLIVKVGYYESDDQLGQLAEIANEYANSVAAINTLPATVVNVRGEQALPGKNRLKSGVCGAGIKWAGLDMVKRLAEIKNKRGYTFSIEGVGGVTMPKDYFEYKQAGANSVMSATGAMWNPFLAQEIKHQVK